ncbi:hypothetical protein C9374_014406 [Naegleria lovaniensis]|uniref:Protein kinase domain-containing protein n=1 Tax=Naegleria lovaniensis TaxID=51637 RepID=A0AA88KPV1_NAELO|nr:uncharacterized protein C9374_014406 [Naegleria lovaniensis]KAG2389006.1 hypothetical protein C9374_014406 [Naegleria lovaniensis]
MQFEITLFVSPSEGPSDHPETLLESNCTKRNHPCPSIQHALHVADKMYNESLIPRMAIRLLLMPKFNSGSLIYGKEQCNIQYSQTIDFLIIESDSSVMEQRIELDCEGQVLFQSQHEFDIKTLLFNMLNISRLHLGVDGTRILNMRHVKLFQFEFKSQKQSSVVGTEEIILVMHGCEMITSKFDILQIFSLNISHSVVSDSDLHTLSAATITMSWCEVRRFVYRSLNDVWITPWQNQLFRISNCNIFDSIFTLFAFKDVSFESVRLYQQNSILFEFTYSVELVDLIAKEGALYLLFQGISNRILISKSEFSFVNSVQGVRYMIEMITCSYVSIENSVFTDNQVPPISISNAQTVGIYATQFYRNSGPCVNAIMVSGVGTTSFSMDMCKMVNNSCSSCNGAALNVQAYFVTLSSEFKNNQAQNGGALYVESSEFLGTYSIFDGNLAQSRGGAIYLRLFDSSLTTTIFEMTCVNNTALFSGGCIFFHSPHDKHLLKFSESSGNVFQGNVGNSYGNDFGIPLYNIDYQVQIYYQENNRSIFNSNSTPEIFIYPGQGIYKLQLELWNNKTERVLFLENDALALYSMSNSDAFVSYIPSNDSIGFRSIVISIYSIESTPYKAVLEINSEFSIEMFIHVLPCPEGTFLTLRNVPGGTYLCSSVPYIPYNVIIPAVAIVTIIIFVFTVLLIYLAIRAIRNIVHRLKMLDRRLRAEKKMESKLLEKRVVLMDGNDNEISHSTQSGQSSKIVDEKTSLLFDGHSSRITKYTNSINNKSSSSATAHSWMISIDEIEIVKRIAEGASGTVYLASWNGTKVALKTLKHYSEELISHGEQLIHVDEEEFEKEASLLANIRHPNIVQFFGVIMAGSKKYLVVEFMEKGSLDKLIYNSKSGTEKIDLFRKIDILLGVAKGMNYLHSLKPKGIIHRDLKPGNVLIDKNSTSKICDFGMSRTSDTFSKDSATTNVGTLFYMSNEMLEGNSSYNHKVDVYSFAIIMWELFFEESPYMNSHSKKIYKFMNHDSTHFNGFNVLVNVLKGIRPVIPFSSENEMTEWIMEFVQPDNLSVSLQVLCEITKQYIELMKACWNSNFNERPDFGEICNRLNQMICFGINDK